MFCLVCCINQHQNIMKFHEASVKNHHVCSVVEYPQLSNVINIYQTKNMVGRSPRLCQVVVSTEFQNGRPWWKPELWALAPRPGIQTQNGIDLFKMMGTCWENVGFINGFIKWSGQIVIIHKPELRPFGMIPLINHDSSEVAVRSLEFTQTWWNDGGLPSGNDVYSLRTWTWPLEIVDLPIQNGDVP